MAQDIEIANAQYNDVPSIEVPLQGGGTASFIDTSDADALASEIDMGKTAYVNGVKLTGTRSGGGGIIAKGGTIATDSGGSSGTYITKSVVFDTPMPNTNYKVAITVVAGSYGFANARPYVPYTSKTVNGFDIIVWCDGWVRDPMTFDWIAILPNS